VRCDQQQSKLAGSAYDEGVDCKRYQFVLGMAVSVDAFTDLKGRVAFDDLTNGQFSANGQGLYDKLRGKGFGELGCHSNGAMVCLAALENKDIKAERVVLYGPQVTRESPEVWDQLVREQGKVGEGVSERERCRARRLDCLCGLQEESRSRDDGRSCLEYESVQCGVAEFSVWAGPEPDRMPLDGDVSVEGELHGDIHRADCARDGVARRRCAG
jgi:hypothetical protein